MTNRFRALRDAIRHRKILKGEHSRRKFFVARHISFEELSSAKDNVKIFDDGAMPLEPEKFTRRDLPESWKFPQPVIVPKIATLRDAVLFDNGLALLSCGRRFCFDDTYFGHRMVPSRGQIGAFAEVIFLDGKRVKDSILVRRDMPCIDVPGRCFSTLANPIMNFGHFVHDVLSRIYYEKLGAIAPGRDKVIAPPWHRPIHEFLFRKVFEGYEIVQFPPGFPIRVEELLLPANLCKFYGFNPAAIAALKRRVSRIMANHVGKEKNKVCVSRRDGAILHGGSKSKNLRDFVNIEAYEDRMRELGYRVVVVSELEVEKQIALWANTTDIVGIHGAGMMNMIMMPSGAGYTEITGITPRGRVRMNSCIRCAMAAGHRVGGLAIKPDAHGRLEIDLDKLEALLLNAS